MKASFAIALLAGLLSTSPTLLGQQAPSGDPVQGRQQFMSFGCWQCHGTTGAGGGWQGPRLAPGPLPFAVFSTLVRTPRAQMPQYASALLTENDMADIYAYLRSIPAGRPASEIDALNR